jgi:hypothetical protein
VPDASPLDELASALVDGEATEAEQARAAEPEIADRVETFRTVSHRVGAPVMPSPDAARERAVLAALAAADEADAADVVTTMRRPRRVPPWLATAAAVLAAVAGFGLLVAALDGSSDDDADSAAEAPAEEEGLATEAEAEGGGSAADAGAETATTPLVPDTTIPGESEEAASEDETFSDAGPTAGGAAALARDLGSFPDVTALEDALRADAAATQDTDDAGADRAAVPCGDVIVGERLALLATAVLADQPVTVAVVPDDNGATRYVVLDQSTCREVAAGPL